MRPFLEIARTGAALLQLHPLRSIVIVVTVAVVLVPFLAGIGIARGLQVEMETSVRFGADVYVVGEQFGRPVPIPVSALDEIRKLPGVTAVEPRIVGRIELGKERAGVVVVGIALDRLPATIQCIAGRLYGNGARNELVVGSDVARQLHLEVGARIPPFYRSRTGEHVSEVVGIFRSDATPWQSRLIVTSFETAERIFDQSGLATDFLVWCRPGYAGDIQLAVLRDRDLFDAEGRIRPRAVLREDLSLRLLSTLLRWEGTFTLLWIVAFAAAILVVLVTSGAGLQDRRREVGILKALGWQTDELLVRSAAESLLLSLIAASLSVLAAYLWLSVFNGYWIADVFIAGTGSKPGFRVPFHLGIVPALLGFFISFVVIASGSAVATWRAARTAPRDAMR